ncbi:hypothetical protein EB001_16860 [bacterium]|nr:hypothetical protein [bacterium]
MTVSIANMAQVWMSNTNTYNGIAMSISTMGYGANNASRLFKLNVDGNTKFDIDANGRVTAIDIVANTVSVNTIIALSSSNAITTGSLTANTVTVNGNTTSGNVTATNVVRASRIAATSSFAAPGVAVQLVYNRVDSKDVYSFATAGSTGSYITSLDTSITPRSATSKILVTYCISYEVHHDTIFRLYRTVGGVDTMIGTNTTDGNYWSGIWYPGYDADNSSTPTTNTLMYLDSPATTSAITYKLMIQSGGIGATTFYLNRSIGSAGQQNYEVAISQVFLQEIAQ